MNREFKRYKKRLRIRCCTMAVIIQTTVLEIKNAVVVVFIVFLKHNGLCGRLSDWNYFYTEEWILCMIFHIPVTLFVCTLCPWPCTQFVKAWIRFFGFCKIFSPMMCRFFGLKEASYWSLWFCENPMSG